MSSILKPLFCVLAVARATMGPLYPDTTTLDDCGSGSFNPGDSNAQCTDLGTTDNVTTCLALCDGAPSCSCITFHGPTTGEWANHCVIRTDGLFVLRPCGAGCDHTSSNKTSGWTPGPPPSPPGAREPPVVVGHVAAPPVAPWLAG